METNVILWLKSFYDIVSTDSLKLFSYVMNSMNGDLNNEDNGNNHGDSIEMISNDNENNTTTNNNVDDILASSTISRKIRQQNNSNPLKTSTNIVDNNSNQMNQNGINSGGQLLNNFAGIHSINNFNHNQSDQIIEPEIKLIKRCDNFNANNDHFVPVDSLSSSSKSTLSTLSSLSHSSLSLLLSNIRSDNNDALKRQQTLALMLKLSTCHKLRSNQFALDIIDSFKNNFSKEFDPFVFELIRKFRINSFMTIQTKKFTVFGFKNVFKTENDGYIKYIGNNRFIMDCTVAIKDIKCDIDCRFKLGYGWHKRIQMRNQILSLNIDKCLFYLEILIDNNSKTIGIQRFTQISHDQIRCRSHTINSKSLNRLVSTIVRRYFEHYFTINSMQLEYHVKNQLSKNISMLNYEQFIIDTSLIKWINLLPVHTTDNTVHD